MAQFGDKLRDLANGYIYHPLEDATGLKGDHNFTLSFSSIGQLRSGPSPGAGTTPQPAETGASDPNGVVSLFEAVRQQLGLKLEKVRRPPPRPLSSTSVTNRSTTNRIKRMAAEALAPPPPFA